MNWRAARVLPPAFLLLLAAGCGSDDTAPPTAGPTPPAPTTVGSGPVPAEPAARCPDGSGVGMTAVGFPALGAPIYGLELGTGSRGVLLVHGEDPAGLCGWTPLMPTMADAGFHVLALDRACVGSSGCPEDRPTVDDVVAAATELRRRGATSVVVVGAAEGAPAAVVAAARPDSGIDAGVFLSATGAEITVTVDDPGTGLGAAPRLRAPALFAVTDGDPAEADTENLYGQVPGGDKELTRLPAGSGAGQQLLYASPDAGVPGGQFLGRFLDFVRTHTGG